MGTKDTVAASPLSQAMAMAVKLHMVRRTLQQKDLVELAGRSEPYWSKRLRGTMGFTLGDVEALASGLGLEVEALMADAVTELGKL